MDTICCLPAYLNIVLSVHSSGYCIFRFICNLFWVRYISECSLSRFLRFYFLFFWIFSSTINDCERSIFIIDITEMVIPGYWWFLLISKRPVITFSFKKKSFTLCSVIFVISLVIINIIKIMMNRGTVLMCLFSKPYFRLRLPL